MAVFRTPSAVSIPVTVGIGVYTHLLAELFRTVQCHATLFECAYFETDVAWTVSVHVKLSVDSAHLSPAPVWAACSRDSKVLGELLMREAVSNVGPPWFSMMSRSDLFECLNRTYCEYVRACVRVNGQCPQEDRSYLACGCLLLLLYAGVLLAVAARGVSWVGALEWRRPSFL